MELVNFNQDIIAQIYKLVSVNLCSNLDGQIMMGLMVNPPQPGSISYDQYIAEKGSILDSLRRRAAMIADTLNKLEGVKCNEVEGRQFFFDLYHFLLLLLVPTPQLYISMRCSIVFLQFY